MSTSSAVSILTSPVSSVPLEDRHNLLDQRRQRRQRLHRQTPTEPADPEPASDEATCGHLVDLIA